jgi:hypothetical protein
MGSFFTNFQVRTASTTAVASLLPKVTSGRAYVSQPKNGWITVYAEESESQDDAVLKRIGQGLSRSLKTDVFSFLLHDSDIAMYSLYRSGDLVDEFNSCPDYFGDDVDEPTRERLAGNVDVLLPICPPETSRKELEQLLHNEEERTAFADDLLTDLAKLLGIDPARIILGLKYFEEEGEQILDDAAEFTLVNGSAATKPKKQKSSAPVAPSQSTGPALDMFPLAIGSLTQPWSPSFQESAQRYEGEFSPSLIKQVHTMVDKTAQRFYKDSKLADLPTFEELKAARDAGPEVLAALLAKRTPSQLTAIGIVAANAGTADFLAALLKFGLNPNAGDFRGLTTLQAAERHGLDSSIYKMVKAAAGS